MISASSFRKLNMLGSVALLALVSACGGDGSPSANEPSLTVAAEQQAQALRLSPTQLFKDAATALRAQTITVRAYASLAGNTGANLQLRVNGNAVASVEVRSTEPQDYVLAAPGLVAGSLVEVLFTNDAFIDGQDRNLFIVYVTDGTSFVLPNQSGVSFRPGLGAAVAGNEASIPGQSALWGNGALRFTWPSNAVAVDPVEAEAARFLHQASFGATRIEIEKLKAGSISGWLDEQLAMPAQPSMVSYIQAKFDSSPDYLPPFGIKYTPELVGQKFWSNALTAPDQLRKRMAFALHSIFVVSQVDSNLFHQARAYANYLDHLDRLAFGNFRALIEEVALSPAMGIYLSHMRSMKEEPALNRLPDENFARELMQLFTIGLYELNPDGTEKLDNRGQPIETYGNADVMALAKVFSGWGWGLDDNQLSEANFRWGMPESTAKGPARADLRRMKAYPGMHSQAEKKLFNGKLQALTIPANTAPSDSVRLALDTLFNHPNVGPFISRQLIQRLVTSNPTPAYVGRIAAVFNNNGKGVRGDLGAVVRAILLDSEARLPPTPGAGKLREPVLRAAHSLRAFNARSASGEFTMATELAGLGQRANYMPSVFGYFRPGYVPPNTTLAQAGMRAPEMQIIDESTVSQWFNATELMLREGLGWYGSVRDVTLPLSTEISLAATSPLALANHINLMLFAGRMSSGLRKNIIDAMLGVANDASDRDAQRARVAIYVAMTSPEYFVQR